MYLIKTLELYDTHSKAIVLADSEHILVSGVAGFIGSHTCEKILQEGYDVIGIDNLNDYYNPKLKENNLSLLKKFDNFQFHEVDIRNFDALGSILDNLNINTIIHLAAQAGVRYSLKNPFIYQQVNIGGTLNLLELTKQLNCKNFIFGSSSSVYGNQKKVPFSEEDQINHPISIYAATKQAGEALCYSYHHLYDINVNCLRFFTVYGPRGRPDMSPHIFATKLLKRETITLFDDPQGTVTRDFSFISDIVEGIVRTIDFQHGFEVFNLGFGSPIKLKEFISILEDITEITAKIEYADRQLGDVDTTHADISKIKKFLGFQPKISVQQGLEIYLDWFKEYYGLF